MKKYSNLFKRTQALVLVFAILLSTLNLGLWLTISADDKPTVTKTVAAIVAENYNLTDAEKAILTSGYLASDSITYTTPTSSDDLISVDIDNKTIEAKNYEDGDQTWVAVGAAIVADGEIQEPVALNNGKGTYTYGENAFSVEVTYELYTEVDTDVQNALLAAPGALKAGVDGMKSVYDGSDANLGTVVLAMDTLETLARGVDLGWASAQFKADAQTAVRAMANQLDANDGKLALQVMNEAYTASAAKSQYLVENGAAYYATATETLGYLSAIYNDKLMNNDILDSYLQSQEPAKYTQWMALKGILGNLVAALEGAIATEWAAPEFNLAADADYAQLDKLIAAVETTSTVTAAATKLLVDTAIVQHNMSMSNVTVNVVLEAVDKDNAMMMCASEQVVLTLKDGATPDEIKAAIEENGIVARVLANEAYVDGKFDVTYPELPDSLKGDIGYTITYSPKSYAVSYNYDTDSPVRAPYGYQLTLPVHPQADKSYDYEVNDAAYAQGDIYTVVGETEVTRSAGKAYTSTDLYTVVSNNFGNDITKAILQSGALKNNVVINYRKPDANDVDDLLELANGKITITAPKYPSSYEGLDWVPYSYGTEGTENLFNGSEEAEWDGDSADVYYVLNLTNFEAEDAQAILDLAATLKDEANAQKSTLDNLAVYCDTLGQLDKTKLGALNGVIDVTDFTPDDGTDTDAENLEIRAYFKDVVGKIIANNLDSNNYLKLYNILGEYENEGLRYYYNNSEKVIAELGSLCGYLNDLLGEGKAEALAIMCTAAGFPEYTEKISDLQTKLNGLYEDLTAPNAAIDLESANLGKLVSALTAEGKVENATATSPYVLSAPLYVEDDGMASVQVIIKHGDYSTTCSASVIRGDVLSPDAIRDLKSDINLAVFRHFGGDAPYYNCTVEGGNLSDYEGGVVLNETVKITYTYTAKEYTVKIDGEADQIVTVEDLEINLPKHETVGWRYDYTINGVSGIKTSTYTFTADDLDALFADGTYTITRVEVNEAREKLENMTAGDEWTLITDENDKVTGLIANVAGTKDGVMGFAMDLVKDSGYTYIAFNGEPFLYMNDAESLEICLQTLVNALLNDNSFGSKTLIDLGNNGKGKLVSTKISLGNSADEIAYEDLDFTLNLTSVPAQMGTVANALDGVKNYMTFRSDNGVLKVDLDLPEKVYEVYLTALLATETVDKTDINAINNEIAFMFLYDYIDAIMNTDATTATYTNTLAMFGKDYDLTGYEQYYQMLKSALTNEGVTVNTKADDGEFDINVAANGKTAIDGLIALLGVDVSAFETYLGMVKEYKNDGSDLTATVIATLADTDVDYEALVLDINATGDSTVQTVLNKFDYTTDLPARVESIADQAVVILLDDVDGNLNFNGTTILDLNGFTVNGNVSAENGTLIIIDSSLAEKASDMGCVMGTVSGNVTIIAGVYASDVTAFLKEGYVQENGVVSNEYYTVVMDENGNLTVELNASVLNAKVLPDVQTIVIDLVTELVLNGYTVNSLSIADNEVYSITLDDIVKLVSGTNRLDNAVQQVVGMVNSPAIANLINTVLADLTDFAALKTAVENDKPVLSYSYVSGAWAVEIAHNTEGDYLTANLTTKTGEEKTIDFVIVGSDSDKARVASLLGALADTTEIKAEVSLDHGFFDESDPKNLIVNAALSADVAFDFSDPDYTIMFCLLLAESTDADTKQAIIDGINDYYETKSFDNLQATFNALTTEQIVSAVKNFTKRNANFEALMSAYSLKLNTAAEEEIAELEAYYDAACLVAKVVAKLANRLDITGGSRLMETFIKEAPDVYGNKQTKTLAKTYSRELVRGYSVTLNAKVEGNLSVTIFVDDVKAPEYVSDFVLNVKDSVLSYVVADGMIIIDTIAEGITKAEFEANLNANLALYTENTDSQTFVYSDKDSTLIYTGITVTATAHNDDTNETDTVTYTIVVLGDVNKNGENDAGDASLIASNLVNSGKAPLDELQEIAADISCNGRTDIGDAVFVVNKYSEVREYNSHLADEQE